MIQIRGLIFYYCLIICILFTACTKEYSQEKLVDIPTLGSECTITTVTPYDSVSGKGRGAFHISLGANNLTGRIEWFDSTSGTVGYRAEFTYIKDTIRINESEFFILDALGRISEFYTLEDPSDLNSEPYKYAYAYDAGGYLSSKKWFLLNQSTDLPFFVYSYTWVDSNLVKVEVKDGVGGRKTILNAELKYDNAKTVKGFLYCFPDALELAPFILSVDLGKKSKNLLEEIEVIIYDGDGNEIHTYNTSYKNYKFTPDDYITEVFASGDMVDGLPVVSGLTSFKYDCK